jgi:hypothetical protein
MLGTEPFISEARRVVAVAMMLFLRLLRSTIGLAILRFVWRRRARLIAACRHGAASTANFIAAARAR